MTRDHFACSSLIVSSALHGSCIYRRSLTCSSSTLTPCRWCRSSSCSSETVSFSARTCCLRCSFSRRHRCASSVHRNTSGQRRSPHCVGTAVMPHWPPGSTRSPCWLQGRLSCSPISSAPPVGRPLHIARMTILCSKSGILPHLRRPEDGRQLVTWRRCCWIPLQNFLASSFRSSRNQNLQNEQDFLLLPLTIPQVVQNNVCKKQTTPVAKIVGKKTLPIFRDCRTLLNCCSSYLFNYLMYDICSLIIYKHHCQYLHSIFEV